MISIEEIDKAILEMEQHDTTFATVEKLAWLYIVKDHNQGVSSQELVGRTDSKSDFIRACENVPVNHVLKVLDEHMECIKALYPKEYSVIIEKIKQ